MNVKKITVACGGDNSRSLYFSATYEIAASCSALILENFNFQNVVNTYRPKHFTVMSSVILMTAAYDESFRGSGDGGGDNTDDTTTEMPPADDESGAANSLVVTRLPLVVALSFAAFRNLIG